MALPPKCYQLARLPLVVAPSPKHLAASQLQNLRLAPKWHKRTVRAQSLSHEAQISASIPRGEIIKLRLNSR